MKKFERIVKSITEKDTEIIKDLMHPDFMLIRESGLISRDEQLEYLKKMFDGDTEWLDFRCCYEDEDTLVWKDLMYINSEDKKVLVTNYEAYKDKLVWSIMPVSNTHLTLPTKREVSISEDAVSLKK